MPAQGSVHNAQRAPHQTLWNTNIRRGRADAARSEPASHACAPRNWSSILLGTPKMRMGRCIFLMKKCREGGDRDGATVLAYNFTRVMNIIGIKPAPRGDPGLRSVYCCA